MSEKTSIASVDADKLSQERSLTSDEAHLAHLGYKQEFQRAFSPIEVFGLGFSIIGLFPSIALVRSPLRSTLFVHCVLALYLSMPYQMEDLYRWSGA